MWTTTLETGDRLLIGDVEVMVMNINRGRLRIGVKAPKEDKIQKVLLDASSGTDDKEPTE